MLTLPPDIMAVLTTFAPLFTRPVWQHVQVLLVGAILAPGRRMVSSVLRVMGLEQVASFGCYHRVLNRAVWSSREASHLLLILVIRIVAPSGPLVLGIDETIERRRGRTITAAGYYRDPVRSTKRRRVEVTFHEVRDHLGVETQRQWSPLAILRTTSALLGLFSLVTLLAHPHTTASAPPVRAAAWYDKQAPTFVDALALVRRQIWATVNIPVSPADTDMVQIPRSLIDHPYQTLAYAA